MLDGSKVSTKHLKFSVTQGGTTPKNWYVGNDGKLTSNPTVIFDSTTKNKIKALESAMSAARITDRKAKLLNKLILYKTNIGNYGIMHVTAVDNSLPGSITFNYKTFNSVGSIKKSENNHTEDGTNTFDLDTGLTGNAIVAPHKSDFWLENDNGKQYFKPENGATFYVLP